jgi:D-lyxose ketol-isomerase
VIEPLKVRPATEPGRYDAATFGREFDEAGLAHYTWGNGPHDRYGEHMHPYAKILVCLEGSIVFHVPGQADLHMQPGDRLLLPPHTRHAATVGSRGVRCIEAHRPVDAPTAAPRPPAAPAGASRPERSQ